MTHIGLIRLLDTGVADGQAYLVMELVEGATLAASLRAEALGGPADAGEAGRDSGPGRSTSRCTPRGSSPAT